ncbi:anti-sigma factor domain-containing protein [Streptomyces boninensis]|uniref:anti-sigma factor n=1 Tax=Streptomyces boninensis TaxID=2039455 RepID=UPI003B214622
MLRRHHRSLGAPYALNALPPREHRRVERHIAWCGDCRERVEALAMDSARLGLAVAAVPPPALRDRVLTAVRTMEQERPEPGVPQRKPGPAAGPASAGRPNWGLRLAVAGAALALVAAALLGVQLTRVTGDLDTERTRAEGVERVLAAPDAAASTARDDDGRVLGAVVSRGLGRAVVSVSGFPDAEPGRDYQLWAMDDRSGNSVRSAGLLPDGTDGPAVDHAIGPQVRYLSVTSEPDGGSPRPTTKPLVQLALPTS